MRCINCIHVTFQPSEEPVVQGKRSKFNGGNYGNRQQAHSSLGLCIISK